MLRVKYTVFLDGVRHRRTRGREHTYEAYNVLTKYKLRVYMSTVARTSIQGLSTCVDRGVRGANLLETVVW